LKITDVTTLTKEQIEELKNIHGPLFKTTICDTVYLCRRLYKQDWQIIMQMRSDNPRIPLSEIDEKIVNMCTVAPAPEIGVWATKEAGVVPSLSMVIRAKSGFAVPELDAYPVVDDTEAVSEPTKPTAEEMAALKIAFTQSLKGVQVENDYYVIRGIMRNEFKQIISKTEQIDQDEEIANRAVIWPKSVDWSTRGAGHCDSISQLVLSISGFNGPTLVEDL
jgi:hypothetical protein